MVQYQYDGNAHLVYAILRRKDVFVKLANLTLPLAIKGNLLSTPQLPITQSRKFTTSRLRFLPLTSPSLPLVSQPRPRRPAPPAPAPAP